MPRPSLFVIQMRGERNFYVAPGEFTPERDAAAVVHEDVARGLLRVLPFAVDAVEVHPLRVGRMAR